MPHSGAGERRFDVTSSLIDSKDISSMFNHFQAFFPRAYERRVLLIAGVCYTSSHLLIFTSTHIIFTSSHLHIYISSSHLHIFTSKYHLHIFSSSHLHISSSHLQLHILSSLSLSLLLFLFSLKTAGGAPRNGHPFARNEVRSSKIELRFNILGSNPLARNEVRSSKNWGKIALWALPRQLFSFEMRFDRQKLMVLLRVCNPFARNEVRVSKKLMVFCEFGWSGGNPFARNEVRVSKTGVKLQKASVCKGICV